VSRDLTLVLNVGSSSIKFAAYHAQALLLRGELAGIGHVETRLSVPHDALGLMAGITARDEQEHGPALDWLLALLAGRLAGQCVAVVGHRVVHGGRSFTAPARIDAAALAELHRLTPLAPEHQPQNIAGIVAAARIWPDAPQIACFDTAFHSTQPELARRFALPRKLHDEGIERFGFHGLSYQFIAESLPTLSAARAEGRVVVAHLGSGASMCALHHRSSVATTMGMTALDGLMMGTRCGALDPGVLLHLLQQHGLSAEAVSDILYKQSGLLGVSGISSDLRVLEASAAPEAEQAQALFAYRARESLASLVAALGGLDVLVFTGGIGTHSAAMRARICDGLGWLGVDLDQARNTSGGAALHSAASRVEIHAVETDEEIVIARACAAFRAIK
jgi:acetate kinase